MRERDETWWPGEEEWEAAPGSPGSWGWGCCGNLHTCPSPCSDPVRTQVIPYVTTIFGGLHAGKMVMLQGVVPLRAHRFQVDFQCGCSLHPQPDIAIHFNPRFHTTKPHVICNTLHSGRWQREARWPGVALQRGASFLILFLFGNEEVKPFLLQSPRLVPCSCALPRGLWPGQVIIVRGLVLQEPKEFTLSLREEATRTPVMLRASFTDRTLAWVSPWGCKKLISAPFLFHPQRFFEVLLLCQEGGLKLALNGQPLGSTSLDQQTLERLREVRISGSIQLYCVHC
uniref:galectin-12-like isoform X14 n=1 Tax=Callospermophilus lateralis TaxID=76772 RepID=UPI004038A3A2